MHRFFVFTILALFSSFSHLKAQNNSKISFYPKSDLVNGILLEPTFSILQENETGYLQISHNNNFGQLSDIFQSNIQVIARTRKDQFLGFQTNFDRIGPLIGHYNAKVNYTNHVTLSSKWKLGLYGAVGILYSKYSAPGVLNPNIVLPDADIKLILLSKNSFVTAGLGQALNSKKDLTDDISFILDRFVTVSANQRIFSSLDIHHFFLAMESNLYPNFTDLHRLNLIYKYNKIASASIGYSSYHEATGFIETELKNSIKYATNLFFVYKKKLNVGSTATTFDSISLGLIIKKRKELFTNEINL